MPEYVSNSEFRRIAAEAMPDIIERLEKKGVFSRSRVPSVQEQMGLDPISKLASAVERLAAALEGTRD